MRSIEMPRSNREADYSADLLSAHDDIRRFANAIKRAQALKKEALAEAVKIWERLLGETHHLQGGVVARAFQAPDGSFYTREFLMEGEPARYPVVFNSSPLAAVIGAIETEPTADGASEKSATPTADRSYDSSVGNVLIVELSDDDRKANFGDIEDPESEKAHISYVAEHNYLALDIETLHL